MSAAASDSQRARRVAFAGILVSAALAVLNIVVGVVTASTSVLAVGVEFAGDVLASTVVLVGLVIALKPADENHPYGHGRVETLAAFVVGLILAVAGLGICWRSLHSVGVDHRPPSGYAILVLVIAITARGAMAVVKFRVGRRLRSASLVADAWNDTVDMFAAGTALTAVGLAMYDSPRFLAADHYGGAVVGVIVVLTALRVLRDASLELTDTMPDQAMMAAIRAVARGVADVRDVEKARARKTGFGYHVDLHIEVDPTLTVARSHDVAHLVQRRILEELSWVADVLVHVEPAGGVSARDHTPARG